MLKLGRPDNRRFSYSGDRRGMVAAAALVGPDVDGVYWKPLREYFEGGRTLVVFAPVHPDDLPAGVAR